MPLLSYKTSKTGIVFATLNAVDVPSESRFGWILGRREFYFHRSGSIWTLVLVGRISRIPGIFSTAIVGEISDIRFRLSSSPFSDGVPWSAESIDDSPFDSVYGVSI
jgi:hypothetical protein